jgi:hypothetical protein
MYEPDPGTQAWLEGWLAQHGGTAGTVHVQRGTDLFLTAAHRIPPPVIAAVTHVPYGKGMAGVAQVRRAPVQTCNLQTDQTGNIKPGAKAVNAQAAVALPVFDDAGEIRAIVGIAWHDERVLDPDQERALAESARSLPQG